MMSNGLRWIGAALVLAVPVPAAAQRPPATSDVAIEHITVIDPVTGGRAADQTILVHGARIVSVGAAATLRPPAGAALVDGRGKFAIPGIWDMHAHPYHNNP